MSHTTTWLNTLRPCVLGLIFLTLLAACDPDAPLATPAPDNAASTAKVTTASATEETTPPSRPAIAKSSEADREALVALYNATDGENWNGSHNWLSDAPLGEWDGVTTDDDGRVTALALYSNGLIGEIPAELGSLSNLGSLDLAEPRQQRVERGDTAGAWQPLQPWIAEPRQQRVERGDTGVVRQPLQPDSADPRRQPERSVPRRQRLERVRAKQPGRPVELVFVSPWRALLLKPRALSRGRTAYRPECLARYPRQGWGRATSLHLAGQNQKPLR